jgi:hypothetical protein
VTETPHPSQSILERYRSLGLVGPAGEGLALHAACPNAPLCWSGLRDRMPPDDPTRSAIALPYVGSRYAELGLLVLGINQNDWGGLGALAQLVRDARAEILEGKIRVFVSSAYDGSPIWHRVGCFAAAFAAQEGLMNIHVDPGLLPASETIDAAYEFLAFTNHVKCSPIGQRSKPTPTMWSRCGELILPSELGALAPKQILVLGVSDNAPALAKSAIKAVWQPRGRNSDVMKGIGVIDGRQIPLYAIPHPSMGRGLSPTVFHELRSTLASSQQG